MGILFDTGLNQEIKYDSSYEYQYHTQNTNTSNYSTQNTTDLVYNPIFNISSPNSNISPTTKKELSVGQSTPTSSTPTLTGSQATDKTDSSKSGIFTTSNLLIMGLVGLGAYFLFKKK